MHHQPGRIQQFRSILDVVPRLTDTIAIVVSLISLGTHASPAHGEQFWPVAILAVIVYYIAAEVTGLFRSWQGVAAEREVTCAALTWLLTIPVLLAVAFWMGIIESQHGGLSRGGLLRWFLLAAGGDRRRANWRANGIAIRSKVRVGIRADLPSSAPTSWDFNWPAISRARRKWG